MMCQRGAGHMPCCCKLPCSHLEAQQRSSQTLELYDALCMLRAGSLEFVLVARQM